MTLRLGSQTLPVLREVDVALIGGSFAGVAAALRLQRDGYRSMVIEPRTYLGREITATLRPWATLAAAGDLGRALLERMGIERRDGEIPLPIDALKRALEDLLLAHDVDLLYASLPVALRRGATGIEGVVIGNKSGRQVIAASTVVDATETALVARLAGGRFGTLPTTARYSRTLEFDRVGPLQVSTLPISPQLGIAGNSVTIRHGYRGHQHVFVSFELDLPAAVGPAAYMRREIQARDISMSLAAFLISQVSAFGESVLGFASFELSGPQTGRLEGPAEDPFIGPLRGLWCLNEAARVAEPAAFRDPVLAAQIGEGVVAAIATRVVGGGAPEPMPRPEPGVDVSFELRELESPQAGRPYARVSVPEMEVPILREADVLVVGGGASGAVAAAAAAHEGVSTVLLEMNPGLGGTGTIGGVHSYWYGRHVGFSAGVEALTDEVHRTLRHTKATWNIEAKMYALLRDAMRAGVDVLWDAIAHGTVMGGNRVRGVVAATRWGPVAVLAEVVIDATGDGDLAAFAGAEFVYGAERDHSTMWYSLAQFTTPGRTRNNFTSGVQISNVVDYTRAILAGRRRGSEVHDHGVYLAPRESRHILAEVILTHTDQLVMRHWPDVVNIHYSNHDVKGPSTSPWVRMGLIPPNLEIEIPYRALIPRGLEGLIIAGKAISATHDALPAIRMQADMENLGGVAALAAVQSVRERVRPRAIDVAALQHRLMGKGLLAEEHLTGPTDPPIYSDDDLRAMVAALDGARPLYAYSDMEMGEIFTGRIPLVDICTAGDRIVPYLEAALVGAEGLRRIHLAQALAFYGSSAAVPVLIEEIWRCLQGERLPVRDNQIRHANYPPDQGAMSDVVYLLYSLGMANDARSLSVFARVVDLIAATEEDVSDRRSGTFYYVEAVCWGMEQLADPAAIPILCRLHAVPSLRDQISHAGFQADYFQERQAFLELCIARARARCGDDEGLPTLIAYLDDARGLLAESAHAHLVALTSKDCGKDVAAWTAGVRGLHAEPCAIIAL